MIMRAANGLVHWLLDFFRTSIRLLKWLFLAIASICIVAFGQPAWSWECSLLAGALGYALFWVVLLHIPSRKTRFWAGTSWFMAVQLIQLSWFTAHPFFYIYFFYLLLTFLVGLQFGLLFLLITPELIRSIPILFGIAGLWTLQEWIRLFLLSGYTWNPVGLALASNLYALQTASLWGIYGLSFWVILTNLFALRSWIERRWAPAWMFLALFPYLFGLGQISFRSSQAQETSPYLHAVVVHTASPVEENVAFANHQSFINYVFHEWCQILQAIKKQHGAPLDLMLLPEYVVPCGTYSFVFPYESVAHAFSSLLGPESLKTLPSLELPFAKSVPTKAGTSYLVNNAFLAQGIANYFQTHLVIGLEDCEYAPSGEKLFYSAAFCFRPSATPTTLDRYEKRVLVPLGEYLPFDWCRSLASEYGVFTSFTKGSQAKVIDIGGFLCGISICYEETFADLMRENKQQGAVALLNLTNDVWYPNSRLPKQHLSHALVRTVENGIPLIRATNAGISGAVDSSGQLIDFLEPTPEFDSLRLKVPLYTYPTLYSQVGDRLVIGISVLAILMSLPALYAVLPLRWKKRSKASGTHTTHK